MPDDHARLQKALSIIAVLADKYEDALERLKDAGQGYGAPMSKTLVTARKFIRDEGGEVK